MFTYLFRRKSIRKGKTEREKERSSYCCLTPQMVAIASSESG